jgi:cytochrome oxidase Cu insertion factor (SCO1/SenC/PrrC family)
MEKWHFISGSTEQTRQLVKKLGMNYGEKPAATGSHMMHSFKTVLISPESEIVATVDNLNPQIIVDKFNSLQRQ